MTYNTICETIDNYNELLDEMRKAKTVEEIKQLFNEYEYEPTWEIDNDTTVEEIVRDETPEIKEKISELEDELTRYQDGLLKEKEEDRRIDEAMGN